MRPLPDLIARADGLLEDYPQITQITQISNPDAKRLILDDRQFDSQPA
jgi:hypothetical protein